MEEPRPTWYHWKWNGRLFGYMWLHTVVSFLYSLVVLGPVALFFIGREPLKSWIMNPTCSLLAWVLVAALSYPTWAWLETRYFEEWVRTLTDDKQRSVERVYFKLMADCQKNFWTAFLAIYSVGGLLGIAFKG